MHDGFFCMIQILYFWLMDCSSISPQQRQEHLYRPCIHNKWYNLQLSCIIMLLAYIEFFIRMWWNPPPPWKKIRCLITYDFIFARMYQSRISDNQNHRQSKLCMHTAEDNQLTILIVVDEHFSQLVKWPVTFPVSKLSLTFRSTVMRKV